MIIHKCHVFKIGLWPGDWHHDSMFSEFNWLKFAIAPTEMTPCTSTDSVSKAVAGFLVTAASAAIGSILRRCATRDPVIGIDSDWQLGLKSVASVHGHSSSMHF